MSCHPGGHLVTGILEREHWTRLTLLYVCASLFLHLSSPFKPRLGRVGHTGWYITFTKGHGDQQSKHYKFARHRNGPEICLNTFGCRDGQLFDRVLMAASHTRWEMTPRKLSTPTSNPSKKEIIDQNLPGHVRSKKPGSYSIWSLRPPKVLLSSALRFLHICLISFKSSNCRSARSWGTKPHPWCKWPAGWHDIFEVPEIPT